MSQKPFTDAAEQQELMKFQANFCDAMQVSISYIYTSTISVSWICDNIYIIFTW